jgi:hypothetical protein
MHVTDQARLKGYRISFFHLWMEEALHSQNKECGHRLMWCIESHFCSQSTTFIHSGYALVSNSGKYVEIYLSKHCFFYYLYCILLWTEVYFLNVIKFFVILSILPFPVWKLFLFIIFKCVIAFTFKCGLQFNWTLSYSTWIKICVHTNMLIYMYKTFNYINKFYSISKYISFLYSIVN